MREQRPAPQVSGKVAAAGREPRRAPHGGDGGDGTVPSRRARQTSQAEYRAIFEASSDGLVINDLDTGIVLEANPAFCRMHGYDRMTGLHPSIFIHPSSQELFAAFVQAVRLGREFRCQAQDVRQDGTVFDVEVLGRTFTYRGKPATLGVVRDVTEHVRAYQVLERRVVERTREIERRREVAEALAELLTVINSKTGLTEILDYVVAQAARLLGSDAEELYLLDERDSSILRLQASRNMPDAAATPTIRLGLPPAGLAAERQRVVVVPDLRSVTRRPFAVSVDEQIEDRGAYLELMRPGPASADSPDQRDRNTLVAAHFHTLVAIPVLARGVSYGALMLGYRAAHLPSQDELELIGVFAGHAGLAIENARVHAELEQRHQELEALYHADQALHRSLRLRDVLDALVETAISLLHADGAGLWGADPQHPGTLGPLAARGLSSTYLEETVQLNHEPGVRQWWWDQPAFAVADVSLDSRVPPSQRAALQREGYSALLSTRVNVGEEVFGSFTVGHRMPHTFSEAEERLLSALAQRAGLAIQNARLYEQAQQAATLEERQRLARELHDAVTQTLFSTALIAEVLPELWDVDPDEGRQQLGQLRRLTRGALAEMRTLLIELRPGVLTELPLGELLRQLAEATTGRTHLEVRTSVEGAARPLPPLVQVALYRVAQEALNNVVKHAQARRAVVVLCYTAGSSVRLRVEDDGRGFDPSEVPAGHLGVGIMRERAAAIGAMFQLRSQPEGGTAIEVRWQDTEDSPA